MIVTDKKYHMEKRLVEIMDLLAERVSGKRRFQNVIITDGQEGYGKTTLTATCAYYQAHKLNRELRLYFDIEKLFNDAKKTEDMIFIWDDAAYAGLSVEGYNRMIVNLIKLLLLARKKRHTYFINIQEVFRLKEPIVARAIGLLHVYSRDELDIGRFVYSKKNQLQALYNIWMRSKRKEYSKWYAARGTFPDALYKIFDENEYEALKDAAIQTIGEEKESTEIIKLNSARYYYATLPGSSIAEKAKHAKCSERQLYRWANKDFRPDDIADNPDLPAAQLINLGYINPKSTKVYQGKPEVYSGIPKYTKQIKP